MFNLKINEKHEKQKRQIDYSTFVAAMSVSLLQGVVTMLQLLDWMKVHCLNWHPTQGLLQMS